MRPTRLGARKTSNPYGRTSIRGRAPLHVAGVKGANGDRFTPCLRRTAEAKRMLAQTRLNLSEIGQHVGYRDPAGSPERFDGRSGSLFANIVGSHTRLDARGLDGHGQVTSRTRGAQDLDRRRLLLGRRLSVLRRRWRRWWRRSVLGRCARMWRGQRASDRR